MNFRPLRVSKLLREELNKIVNREIDPRGALITITEVVVDSKLEHAIVNVSVIPSSAAEKRIGELHALQGRLQHLLMKKVRIKPFPRIEFKLDRGIEDAARVEKLLLEEQNNDTAR